MKPFRSIGECIRPTDKDLVFHTALALLPVFLLSCCFYLGQLLSDRLATASLSRWCRLLPICCSLVWGCDRLLLCPGDCCASAIIGDGIKQLIHRP